MLLTLENIGKIHDRTEIILDGITILAGENGTGKSTIGKALFCIFDTFYDLEEQIHRERISSVRRALMRDASTASVRSRLRQDEIPRIIVEEYQNSGSKKDVIADIIRNNQYLTVDVDCDNLIDKIVRVLDVSDDVITENLLSKRLFAEFGDKIGNVNHPDDKSKIEVNIREKQVSCQINSVDDVKIIKDIDILKDIVYLSDTYAIDMMSNNMDRYWNPGDVSHFGNLLKKISIRNVAYESVIEDVLLDERLTGIIDEINQAGVGDLIWKDDMGWVYSADKLVSDISIKNVSSGVKSFILLRQLIKTGCIEEKGVIIFDEPEVHLHPKWQKVFAEIIVKMQREFNLTILISTHSTDFLSFIEYYSNRNGIDKLCNYYMVTEDQGKVTSSVENVTGSLDRIYAQLGEPFLRVSEQMVAIEEEKQ